jgi:hypothetical protein
VLVAAPGPAARAGDATPAAAADLWSLRPVVDPAPPVPRDPSWARNPIDQFILARLDERGLAPVPDADRATLLRRVTFDLHGLPPTPEELDAFRADPAPDAFPKVVERLLASPRYGERWGRHWLDVARYADTAGDNADYPVPEARLYRDYVIDSFNADKPYDQFVREQLAGDLIARDGPAARYAERVTATGFIALSRRYATAPYEFHYLTIEDTIETTGRAFLGMTFRCARCHDHKYDPVSIEDYYALYGVFASTQYPYAGSEEFASKGSDRSAFVPLLPPEQASHSLAALARKVGALEAEIARVNTEDVLARRVAQLDDEIAAVAAQVAASEGRPQGPGEWMDKAAALRRQRDAAAGQLAANVAPLRAEVKRLRRPGLPADLPGAYAAGEAAQVADVAVQLAGDPGQPGAVVARGVPRSLGCAAVSVPDGSSGRLELANWIVSPANPLTARVMVNRVWQHHFGRGIVATPSNFGARGEPPTHPELLDYLAARFVEGGWSIKAVHRLILSSRTYQLASVPADGSTAAAAETLDPANHWLARASRRRLDAEALRDAMLFASGNLDPSRPDGPHPFPPVEQWGWTQHAPFKAVYPSNRRSVYLMTQRIVRHPYLALFDAPDTNNSTDARTSAIVPSQALFLMNNPFVREQAESFARRLAAAAATDAGPRIELAIRLAWGRPPESGEVEAAMAYVARYAGELTRAGTPTEAAEAEAWVSYAKIVLTSNEFLYVD